MSIKALLQHMGIVRGIISVTLICLAGAVLMSSPTDNPAIAWSGDPTLNTVICAAGGDQVRPVAIGDGYSGTIIVWQDSRASSQDIYAQRLDPSGTALWTGNGVAVCKASCRQVLPTAVSDGHGGAIIAWQDCRSSRWDIYAQRIGPAGALLWTDNGVPVCTAVCSQVSPVMVSDGAGGAIIVWQDKRHCSSYDIYAQRIDASGATQWIANDVPVCTAAGEQTSITAVSDSEGGAIIAWQDKRRCGYDIYAQRMDSSGIPLWAANGRSICTAQGHQIGPVIVEDGCGGAIIAWSDGRNDTKYDVYGQHVNSAGAIQWAADGAPVCTAPGDQDSLYAINDGSDGAIIIWQDSRSRTNRDVYGQRVDSTSSVQWTADSVPICTAPGDQGSPIAVRGSAGGAIVVWQDTRNGDTKGIYAQRLDSTGSAQWTADGTPVCVAPGNQGSLSVAGDSSGGAVIVWQDSRNPTRDIYAQRVLVSGLLCLPPNQPSNLSPADGEDGVSLTPTLQCSAFSPGEPGDCHTASQWRMTATAGDYSSPVFDSGTDVFALRQVTVGSGELTSNTTYYWQVRHLGSNGLWSLWSEETSFTTRNRPPDRPQGIEPKNGATGISLTPTLQSSAFLDPDVGDTHAASQWRITATSGDYNDPVFLTPELYSNLTEVTVDNGCLIGHTTYYWQVRHQDNQGAWSEWSEERSFTTANRKPQSPAGVSPPSGAKDMSLSPTLVSSCFSDPDTSDTHTASQWQIRVASGDYSNPVFTSGTDNTNLLCILVPAGKLNYSTTYFWRVQHEDNHGAWSDWSEESSFTTQSAPPVNPPITPENHPPDRPVCTKPENGADNISPTPTLEASAFHDMDADDTQAASQWQITTEAGDYQNPIFDGFRSGNYAAVPTGTLSPDTTYYWRARYQDNHGAWSEWSEESSFNTAEEASSPENKMAANSWIYLGIVAAVAILATAAVAWQNARANRMASE